MSTAASRIAELPAWVDEVSSHLEAEFGPGPVGRGRAYADDGRVLQLVPSQSGDVLLATVRGSGSSRYQALIRVQRHESGLLWQTHCSCPVGADCKHIVAVLIEASRRRGVMPGPTQLSWESILGPLAAPPAQAEGRLEAGLLLQWSSGGALPAPGEPVELRPVRRGASGRWVTSDMTWSGPRHRPGLSAPALAAYGAIRHATQGRRPYYSSPADSQAFLGDLGPGAARLLGDVARAGLVLGTRDQRRRVRVVDAAATASVDVRRSPDGAVTVQASWSLAERHADPAQTRLIGSPPTVLLATHADELLLAEVAPIEPSVLPLIGAGQVVVPAAEAPRFLAGYYPLLSRRVATGSSDQSCPPPTTPAPRLRLDVAHEPQHRAVLRWTIDYGAGLGPFPLGAAERLAAAPPYDALGQALRDAVGEDALLAEAAAVLDRIVPAAVSARGLPQHLEPKSPATLEGMQTALFCAEALPALRAMDGIDVVEVGDAADYRHVELAPVVRLGLSDPDAGNDWFDLAVSVDLDGEEVPFRPLFEALAQGSSQLLLASGAWFSLERPELARLRELIEEARAWGETEGPLRLSRWQAGLWEELTDVGVVETQSTAWTRVVAGLLDPAAQGEPPPPPSALQARLRPYQLEGYRWLTWLWRHRLGGILADDMGLGKTVQALAAIVQARDDATAQGDAAPAPVLVLAPSSVIGTWVAEAARFAPGLRVRALTETAARRGSGRSLAEVHAEADVVVTSYGLLRLESTDYLAHEWAAVLLDEAQFVKNPRGKTHHTVRALRAPVKIAITGTPLENSLVDLWALLAITAPGLFPKPEVFTTRYRRPIESGSDPQALARLQRRVRPLMLRRTKELVAPELPPKQEQVQMVTLAPAHQRLYDRQLQRERQRVLGLLADFDKNRIAIFRSLTILRQLALSPALVDADGRGAPVPSAKIEAFMERIGQIAAEGHRALVFSQFTGFLSLVRAGLETAGIEYGYLDGQSRNRADLIRAWREGTAPVFLISLKAGGFGLTLTEADYVFVLDPWWNPAAEAQAVDRTHRIGQDKTVMVYRLIAQGTIEEKVLALQQRKRDLFTRVIDEGGAIDGTLTADDIRGLLEASPA